MPSGRGDFLYKDSIDVYSIAFYTKKSPNPPCYEHGGRGSFKKPITHFSFGLETILLEKSISTLFDAPSLAHFPRTRSCADGGAVGPTDQFCS